MKIKTKRGARRIRNQRVITLKYRKGDVVEVTREYSRLYNSSVSRNGANHTMFEGDSVEILETSFEPMVIPTRAPRRSETYSYPFRKEYEMLTCSGDPI